MAYLWLLNTCLCFINLCWNFKGSNWIPLPLDFLLLGNIVAVVGAVSKGGGAGDWRLRGGGDKNPGGKETGGGGGSVVLTGAPFIYAVLNFSKSSFVSL